MKDTKSVTPKGDVTWYIKWAASIIMLMAVVVRASGVPSLVWLDMTGSFLGSVGWLIVGIMWRDRALVLLNSVIMAVLLVGILNWLFGQ